MEEDLVRETTRAFIAREVAPHYDLLERQGFVSKEIWRKAGEAGLLCLDVGTDYGGMGVQDYALCAAVIAEIAETRYAGLDLANHSEMVAPYFSLYGTPEQKERWLPRMVSGECVGAIALSEPEAGSDLAGIRTRAERTRDGWRLNGQKTYINNGSIHDLAVVAARTHAGSPLGISLFAVERGMPGYTNGPPMRKIGLHAQDTTDLFFDDVRVSDAHLIGRENAGFGYVMEVMRRERLIIAVQAVHAARGLLREAVTYAKERRIRGEPLTALQNTRFVVARLHAKIEVARSHLAQIIPRVLTRRIMDAETALAKWWCTETLVETASACVQICGGAGVMMASPVARGFCDARAATIYGGASEVMLEIVAKEALR